MIRATAEETRPVEISEENRRDLVEQESHVPVAQVATIPNVIPSPPPAVLGGGPPKEGEATSVDGATTTTSNEEAEERRMERLKHLQKMNAAVATAERRSNERPGVMKRARWGATHRIHEHFVDGFPELEERFVREREAAERRFEYNLGSRNFASKREGEEGIDTLKVLFRKLDRAIGIRDATMVQSIREEFLAELRHWNWRKGARVEFKRRKTAQFAPHPLVGKASLSDDEAADSVSSGHHSSTRPPTQQHHFPPPPPSPPPPHHFVHNNTSNSSLAAAKNSFSAQHPSQHQHQQMIVDSTMSSTKGEGEDDSSVDDLDADDVNAIDDRFRRVSPEASTALKVFANSSSSSQRGGRGGHSEKADIAEARRHLLAESVAIALVTLKWKSMQPQDIELIRNQADENQRQQQRLGMLDA